MKAPARIAVAVRPCRRPMSTITRTESVPHATLRHLACTRPAPNQLKTAAPATVGTGLESRCPWTAYGVRMNQCPKTARFLAW